jgi:hypothetical protein
VAEAQTFSVRRGDDCTLPLVVQNDDGSYADVGQTQVARFTYGYSADGAPLAAKQLDNGISVGTAVLDQGVQQPALIVAFPAAETQQLEGYRTYYYQARITIADQAETVLTGSFTVGPSQDPALSGVIVEDGTGLPNATYVALSEADAYHLASGSPGWLDADVSPQARFAALVRATRYIDGAYRWRFSGLRLKQRDQALEWPRTSAVAMGQYPIGYNEIPKELRAAVCEAALRELTKPGTLSPDVSAPVTMVQAESVQVQFGGGGYTANQSFVAIDMLLVPILMPMEALSGKVGRG